MINKEKMESTVDLMLSDDYKERFRAEFFQLYFRCDKLAKMLYDWEDGKLGFEPTCDHFMYVEQLKAMREYLHILAERAEEEGIDISMKSW